MTEHVEKGEEPLAIDKLRAGATVWETFAGVGVMLGLSLLWLLEAVRNVFFRALDRLNLRPRPRRASAFPPGRPRKHAPVDARR
jgi:hypothetical protein